MENLAGTSSTGMITVKLFGILKTLSDQSGTLSVCVEDGAQVRHLVEALRAANPQLGELLSQKKVVISVNQEIAHPDTEISRADEIALLPPFAGG